MESEKQIKILLLEDREEDAFMIERILRKDQLTFISQCVDTRDEFNEAIRNFQPDVILSDHGLPGFNSREALKISLKERPAAPFILVTGTVSDEYAVTCLRQGADDYILKDNLSRLPMAIRNALKRRRLEKLKREARHALRMQNQELLKVNRELDNFVYSVSHNLRGPLASMIGLLTIAKAENKSEKLTPLLDMMGGSMARLDETLKEILDYSRNARSELQLGEIDWEALIATSWQKLEYLHKETAITTTLGIEGDIAFFSDGTRLLNIITNLMSNAIIFGARDRERIIAIDINIFETNATISINDNGIGIKQDVLPHVWQMFFRGSEESRGAGLGLYIVREIVGRLKGNISITSQAGQGTTVTVVVPNERFCELAPLRQSIIQEKLKRH